VEEQGGNIEVESAGENLGASFRVTLVNVSPGTSPPVEGEHQDVSVTLKGVRVLVVDDDADARVFISHLLSGEDAVVMDVADAPAAIAALDQFEPQVVISDIGLPGVDGYDLIRQVRQRLGPSHAVPAIALTAFVRDDDRHRALQAGYSVHLPKPVDGGRLLRTISRLVEEGREGR